MVTTVPAPGGAPAAMPLVDPFAHSAIMIQTRESPRLYGQEYSVNRGYDRSRATAGSGAPVLGHTDVVTEGTILRCRCGNATGSSHRGKIPDRDRLSQEWGLLRVLADPGRLAVFPGWVKGRFRISGVISRRCRAVRAIARGRRASTRQRHAGSTRESARATMRDRRFQQRCPRR